MIVVMETGSTQSQIEAVLARLREHNLRGHLTVGEERTVVAVVGAAIPPTLREELEHFDGVKETVRITQPYKLVSREVKPSDTIVQVGDVKVGGGHLAIIAGPCSVESEAQIMATARAVREAGANMLRGGAFKPRSSPYSFRGLGEYGLQLLAQARAETGLPIVTEVMTPADVELVAKYADVLQIGARNMQNYQLLEEAGRAVCRCCSSAAYRPRSKSGCSRRNTSLRRATPTSSSANAASAPSRQRRATPSTSTRLRWSRNARTCR